ETHLICGDCFLSTKYLDLCKGCNQCGNKADEKNDVAVWNRSAVTITACSYDCRKQIKKRIKRYGKVCYICSYCRESASEHCSKCKRVYYCSRECQTKDWTKHKLECKKIN